MANDTIQSLLENTTITVLSRLSMLALSAGIPLLVYFGSSWAESKYDALLQSTTALENRIYHVEGVANADQIKNIQQEIFIDQNNKSIEENSKHIGVIAEQTGKTLDKLNTSIDSLADKVNAASALLGVVVDRENRNKLNNN